MMGIKCTHNIHNLHEKRQNLSSENRVSFRLLAGARQSRNQNEKHNAKAQGRKDARNAEKIFTFSARIGLSYVLLREPFCMCLCPGRRVSGYPFME